MFDVSAGVGGQAVMDGTSIGFILSLFEDRTVQSPGNIIADVQLTAPISYDEDMRFMVRVGPAVSLDGGMQMILPGSVVRIDTGVSAKMKEYAEDDRAKAWLARWVRR